MIYPPARVIILIILSFNVIGDALRDAFESRCRSGDPVATARQ